KPLELLIPILDVLELRRNAALWTLQQCDFVTVSVSALHSYVRTLTDKPVFVVPNAFNIDKFKLGLIEKQKEDVITIGWSGGRRNELDIADMVVGWERIADTYDNVKFIVGG